MLFHPDYSTRILVYHGTLYCYRLLYMTELEEGRESEQIPMNKYTPISHNCKTTCLILYRFALCCLNQSRHDTTRSEGFLCYLAPRCYHQIL